MSADDKAAAAWDDYVSQQQEEKIEELERELNAAKQRIQRLEEAGDALASAWDKEWLTETDIEAIIDYWYGAKEDKP